MSDDSPARVVAAQDETSGLSDQLRRCKAELDECETRTADDYEDDVPA